MRINSCRAVWFKYSMNCDRVMQIRNIRGHLRGRAMDEHWCNFAPYNIKKRDYAPPVKAKRPIAWSAKFLCLASTDAENVPSSVAQK